MPGPLPEKQRTVVWFHNKSTFYTNNYHKQKWVHQSKIAVLYAKEERVSLIVADFVLADYRWLCLSNRSEAAQVLF